MLHNCFRAGAQMILKFYIAIIGRILNCTTGVPALYAELLDFKIHLCSKLNESSRD